MTIEQIWNEKFSREGYLYGKAPNAFLKEHIDTLPSASSILFLGEGEGRNACYAASLGHDVTALDASTIALEKAKKLALELHVDIKLLHVDLEDWEPVQQYDTIMCSFLHLKEPLRSKTFQNVIKALKPTGTFYGEFFSTAQLPLSSGGPKDIDLLYTTELLKTHFSTKNVIIKLLKEITDSLQEGTGHQGNAKLVRLIVKKRV